MKQYDHIAIEKKWQSIWQEQAVYEALNTSTKPKFYILDMFPYPSGEGLHVGHPRGYISSDVYARLKRMQGYNVLHPMGYDAFGLPAEQFAIKHKIHPKEAVDRNVATFEEQLSIIGLSYDWKRKVNTTDPGYYKWTQWIFLKLYDAWYDTRANKARPIGELVEILEKDGNKNISGVCSSDTPSVDASTWHTYSQSEREKFLMKYRLAYEGYSEVNWSPSLGTVLANDEVIVREDGSMVAERDEQPVIKKSMRQWFMRITAYAERLLQGLETIEWSEPIKEIQRNWIGKSEGSEIVFPIADTEHSITVFTTRPDTLFGATYVVLAPEHNLLSVLKEKITNWKEVEGYISKTKQKAETERLSGEKKKTGVVLEGLSATNPATKELLPVWIADYVLASYGTGAVMAVPAHDERDFDFAKTYQLPIVSVIEGFTGESAYTDDGVLIHSGTFSGMQSSAAKKKITEGVGGTFVVKYKMRDAIFARQRYWGEPIPLVHNKDGTITPLTLEQLPLTLPDVVSYEPTGTGESPLASISDWVARGYETNTMPGWAGSSWYFLRYMDPNNTKEFVSKEAVSYWKDVDMYIGGAEHATGHLLYSRFWHKFLFDFGYVPTDEPFKCLRNQGMILATDGRKMSKRWGNVINPDEIVKTYGADTLRLYEMFIGPFGQSAAWSTESIIGPRRFIERLWRMAETLGEEKLSKEGEVILNQTIKKVEEDTEAFRFNTAISQLMICLSGLEKEVKVSQNTFEKFLIVAAPYIPHVAEELWSVLGHATLIVNESWPVYDTTKLQNDTMTIAVQINGKVREELTCERTLSEQEITEQVLALPKVQTYLEGKKPLKIMYIQGKLVSIVLPKT